ncbi:MAG: Gfo/Idh/MocA family oxidoreductase [Planctomycetia bacterium]|nr:Gfo/Idh/MocA family oxidoreductase [Planctomycetia bacterium]
MQPLSPAVPVIPFEASASLAPAPCRVARPGNHTLRVGLVGCGAFARFAAAHYSRLPDVTITAVADVDPAAARRAAADLEAEPLPPDDLLVSPEIDMVYIATPPALHHRQASAALLAGRHVLVEKPLATTLADAEELEALAARRGLVCVANLVERYNPLADVVRRIIDSRILGGLVHGLFINEAADEGLSPRHWFWNRDISGGIFVEHGVHFFDLVAFWLGAGQVVSACRSMRPAVDGEAAVASGAATETGRVSVEEQVFCTCRYAVPCGMTTSGDGSQPPACDPHGGVLFHFEHGFHQPSRMDRQEMRLVFERGELRLFDWVPTHGEIHGLLDDDAVGVLAGMLPGSEVRTVQRYEGDERRMRGRFQSFEATSLVDIGFTLGMNKLEVYGLVVQELAADQIARIRDPGHVRRLTEIDSVASVALACAADQLAMATQ